VTAKTTIPHEMSDSEIDKSRRLNLNQKPEDRPPVCSVCRVALIRVVGEPLGLNEQIVWQHPVRSEYDGGIEIEDQAFRTTTTSNIRALFQRFHKESKEMRQPPGELTRSGLGGPAIDIPFDPDFKYDEEEEK